MADGIKYKYEEVKYFVEKLGYNLVSDEYINARTKLILKDNSNYYYTICFSELRIGTTPSRFHKINPYTIQNIKNWCKLNNKPFELISEDYKGCDKKLTWKCLKPECGEIFISNWENIFQDQNCSVCSGKQVSISNCLATKNPNVAKEWHTIKNGTLTPYCVTEFSNKSVWWKCSKNPSHEWKTRISKRSKGQNCPYCAGLKADILTCLATKNPELAKEWHPTLNGNLTPYDVTINSGKKVWWQCNKNPKHIWKAIIDNRSKGSRCPYCSGKLASDEYNLLIINPELCKEWNYNKNINNPSDYTPGSDTKVWWVCKKGHEWKATISNRNNGRGCPECKESKGEEKIKKWFKNNTISYESQKEFEGLTGLSNRNLSYDFYLIKHNLLIEYQGKQHQEYIKGFHKSKKDFIKQQEHDKRKREYAQKNGVKLLEIWYWDFDNIEEILQEELFNSSFLI